MFKKRLFLMRKKIVCLLMLLAMTTMAPVNTTTAASANDDTQASACNNTMASAEETNQEVSDTLEFNDVTITCYNAVASQCSGNPLITASGRKIDLKKLNKGELRYCAVSRDLLKEYNYGDTIEVFISEGHPYNGEWLVADTMHKRWNKRIDLLLSTKQKSGKWEGQMRKSDSVEEVEG